MEYEESQELLSSVIFQRLIHITPKKTKNKVAQKLISSIIIQKLNG